MTSFEFFPWFVNFIRVWNCHVGIDTKNVWYSRCHACLRGVNLLQQSFKGTTAQNSNSNSSLNSSHKTTDETVTGHHWNQRLSAGCQIFRVLYSLWLFNLYKKLSQVTFNVPWLQAPYCFICPCICIIEVLCMYPGSKGLFLK